MPFIFKLVNNRLFLRVLVFFGVMLSCLSQALFAQKKEAAFQGNTSKSYEEAIATYKTLADAHSEAHLIEVGMSDSGKALHCFVLSSENPLDQFGQFSLPENKAILFINNGIHPGEPCGIDASIQFAERILNQRNTERQAILDQLVIAIIPVYNVGGALNRNCCSRANQNGPEEYGFRGNAKNLDLNRDFIKLDSENARSLVYLLRELNPHVFIDTHTSNGADYQYVMTMIATQPDKASAPIGNYIREKMSPSLYADMEKRGYGMTPYVYGLGRIPDEGIKDFLETPRYSTGYNALFNTIGYTSETHMLKPFAQRVESTYQFLMSTATYMSKHKAELIALKSTADEEVKQQKVYPLTWELDTVNYRLLEFKGFEASYPKSEVSGAPRLRYDRGRPFTKEIKYFDNYIVKDSVVAPEFYIIPWAWKQVWQAMQLNGVKMSFLKKDSVMRVEAYFIDDFSSTSRVYEGHHMNTVKSMRKDSIEITFRAGDVIIPVNQACNRYIVETLEPKGVDAFFVWNFFDSAFQQKEWYSDYVFEDTAARMLAEDGDLKRAFEEQKRKDVEFASDPRAQLYWLYQRSANFEPSLNRYPVYRGL